MRPDLPWSVAGISAEAREAARAAARREGLSVGEWLTRRIVSELSDMNEPRSQWTYRTEPRMQPERQRIQSDEMLERVARSETETAEVYRRIEDQLRGMARRLDASERSQSESNRVMSKAAVEMNIAAREQSQAFEQLGAHVTDLADRLDRVETRDQPGDGMREAVKALHQGLSRLADQITETANQSATQISSLADNLETVAGRVGQARQDAMAVNQALESRLNAIDERVHAVEAANQAQAGSIDRALHAVEEQKRAPSPMEAINRLEGRLEDSVRRLEERKSDPTLDRRLNGIERTMADLKDRIESRDDAVNPLEEALRNVVARLEGLEAAQREAAAELRRAAAMSKPVEPPPPPPPPPPVATVAEPPEPPPAAAFEPPPFATEAPPFAEPAPAAATIPPFAALPAEAPAFELPPDPGFAPLPGLAAAIPAEAPGEDYLAAARRSARAAAEQENERSATLGALRWGSAKSEDAEAPKKKSNPLLVGLLVLIIAFISAALFLRWQAVNNAHPAAPATATVAAKTPAKPVLHESAVEAPLPPAPAAASGSAAPAAKVPAASAVPAAAKPAGVRIAAAPSQPAQASAATQQQPRPIPTAPLDRLTQAANTGNARAQLIVGLKYLDGDGVPVNQTEAAKWLTKAADAGEPVAQYRLGGLYEGGLGVAADPVKAVRLYLAAANQGSRKAMHNLAVAYAEGKGVKKDYAEASRWFLKAATLGLKDSQFNLAVLYERGYGVPQNLVDAYKWYAIAASQGDGESKNRMGAIASQLDSEARAAAQHAADAFQAAPLNARANVAPTLGSLSRG
jgi:localization factor PodJL